MYRPNDLIKGLDGVIAWRQNYNVSEFTISDSLTTSETGQYFQDFHPLLTLDNIKSIAPDFENITYPGFVVDKQYLKDDRVTVADVTYKAKQDNIGKPPATSPNDWTVFDAFSEWLEQKTKASVLKAIKTFWDVKVSKKTAKNILESKALFNGAGRLVETIENTSNMVGFEIVPIRANGITLKIDKIGLQFTETQTVKMYLFHSSNPTAIKTVDLVRTKNGGMEWFSLDSFFLPYVSDSNDAGGSWFLCYDQSSLTTGKAINKNKDWSSKPCLSCDAVEIQAYNIWSKYLEIHPFKTSEHSGDPIGLWDISKNLTTYSSNYGLNLQLTIECDVTDIIIEQRRTFQNLIGLQVAMDFLRELAFNASARIGREQQVVSKEQILYELDGDSQGYKKSGIKFEFDKVLKALEIDTTSLSRVCFPCNNKGVRYKTT